MQVSHDATNRKNSRNTEENRSANASANVEDFKYKTTVVAAGGGFVLSPFSREGNSAPSEGTRLADKYAWVTSWAHTVVPQSTLLTQGADVHNADGGRFRDLYLAGVRARRGLQECSRARLVEEIEALGEDVDEELRPDGGLSADELARGYIRGS